MTALHYLALDLEKDTLLLWMVDLLMFLRSVICRFLEKCSFVQAE